jgi:hypothetical protein
MKVFLYPNPVPPFNLVLCWPAYADHKRPAEMTDDEFLDYVIGVKKVAANLSDAIPIYIVDSADLPETNPHSFFDAWEWSD